MNIEEELISLNNQIALINDKESELIKQADEISMKSNLLDIEKGSLFKKRDELLCEKFKKYEGQYIKIEGSEYSKFDHCLFVISVKNANPSYVVAEGLQVGINNMNRFNMYHANHAIYLDSKVTIITHEEFWDYVNSQINNLKESIK